jgi:chromosome segregation ATPase
METTKNGTKSYNDIVSALRSVARDYFRLGMINHTRTHVLEANNAIEALKKDILESEKRISIIDFRITQLVEADPEFVEKTEQFNKSKAAAADNIKMLEEDIAAIEKNLVELNTKISDITEGKVKVDMDKLEDKTQELLAEVTKTAAVEAVKS